MHDADTLAVDAIMRATKLTNQVAILLAIKTFANTVVTLAESASTAHGSLKVADRATPYISRVEDFFQYGKREKIWEVTKLKSVSKVVSVCFVLFFRCHKNLHTP